MCGIVFLEQHVHRYGQERSSADVRGEALGQEPEREDQPEGIQANPVKKRGFCSPAHAEQARAHPFDYGERYAGEYQKQEEIHQEEEDGSSQRGLVLGDEVIEEYRVIEQFDPVGHIDEALYMSEKDKHEPAEGYAGVHEAQKLVPLPQFHMYEAVEEDVLDVLPDGPGRDEGQQESLPVTVVQLEYEPYRPDDAVRQNEYHSYQERDDEGVEARGETVNHFSPSP